MITDSSDRGQARAGDKPARSGGPGLAFNQQTSEANSPTVADSRALDELRIWWCVRGALIRGALGEASAYRGMTLEELDSAWGITLGGSVDQLGAA